MPSSYAPESIRALDRLVIEQVVREFTPILLHAAFGLGFKDAEAEELVQETFVCFYGSAPEFKGDSTLKPYLFSILHHKASHMRRRQGGETATDPLDDAFEQRFSAGGFWAASPRGPEDQALNK